MPDTVPHLRLTHAAALKILDAGMAKAKAMGVPQCISVVDDGGNLLAFVRMDGAKFLSIQSSLHKAMTAAASRRATAPSRQDPTVEIKLAVTTDGENVALFGGIPILVDGTCVGGIGVGSGTGEQDREVAIAAVAAVEGAQTKFD
jgi:uncharacterized protein GlcG (DUF336 family)